PVALRPRTARRLDAGQAWGLLGVLAFSMSLPATRASVPAFGAVTVGIGRAVLAAVLAAVALLVARAPRPSAGQGRRLALVVVAGALGYAEGGALAREMPGWQVIAWALLLALPVTVPVSVVAVMVRAPVAPGAGAWAGLAYVAAVSMFLGFVAWYRGLALGGV